MALRFSSSLFGCTAIAAAGASLALVFTPGTAQAQVYVQYPAPPPPPGPPPPPPPPRRYYYREYRPYYREPPPEAPSAVAIGLDLEGAVPINAPQLSDGNSLAGGTGIKVRIGEQIRLTPWLRFTPEVGYGYDHLFANNDDGTAYSWDMNRVFGGARLAFGRFIVPSIYGHVGYGWRTTGDPSVQAANGLAIDVGAALDIRIVRQVQFGVHTEWVTINAQPYAPDWLAMGAHIDLAF